jgi:hypothetical protein
MNNKRIFEKVLQEEIEENLKGLLTQFAEDYSSRARLMNSEETLKKAAYSTPSIEHKGKMSKYSDLYFDITRCYNNTMRCADSENIKKWGEYRVKRTFLEMYEPILQDAEDFYDFWTSFGYDKLEAAFRSFSSDNTRNTAVRKGIAMALKPFGVKQWSGKESI